MPDARRIVLDTIGQAPRLRLPAVRHVHGLRFTLPA
jgi:hypothetical protein